jgi:hypothetical protein
MQGNLQPMFKVLHLSQVEIGFFLYFIIFHLVTKFIYLFYLFDIHLCIFMYIKLNSS